MTREQIQEALDNGHDAATNANEAILANERLRAITMVLETMRQANAALDGFLQHGMTFEAESMKYVVDTYQEILQHVMFGNFAKAKEVAGA